ncbi:MAG: TIGR03915 family putative DNA repair protein [Saccharofermentanales bacterium]
MFYMYDGSFEGLLSAITMVMRSNPDAVDPAFCGILEEGSALTLLDYMTVDNIPGIVNDFGEYIRRNFGEDMTKTIYQAYLSEIDGIENAILEYLYLARKLRIDPISQLYRDCVKKVAGASLRSGREANRYLGLLRFRKKSMAVPGIGMSETADPGIALSGIALSSANSQDELFIAECEPESCCLPLIADHFVQRFPNQRFVIFDKKRHICVIHIKGHEWTICPYDASSDDIDNFETQFEHLWKRYFKALSIPERENPKLQMGIMPKRYWKYLIEKPGRK